MCRQLDLDITALVGLNSSGTAWGVAERYVYDPYGTPTVLNGASGFDADGSVTEWTADTGGASDVGFGYGHQGGRQMWADTKVDFRNRFLLTNLGRWGQQDPIRYIDGANLYEYVASQPISFVDSIGLRAAPATQPSTKSSTQPSAPTAEEEAAKLHDIAKKFDDDAFHFNCATNAALLQQALLEGGPYNHWTIDTLEGKRWRSYHNVVVVVPREGNDKGPFILDAWGTFTCEVFDKWKKKWGPSDKKGEREKYDKLDKMYEK